MEHLIQKTIEEFIRTDGQYTTMVKIPVKKTQLHNELKRQQTQTENNGLTKNSNNSTQMSNIHAPGGNTTMMSFVPTGGLTSQQNAPNANKQTYENETPQQRIARRKEEQRREQEEKMKNAARESLMARNQDKQRKNKELQGNISLTSTKQIQEKSATKFYNETNQNRNSNNQYDSPTQFYNPNPIGQNQNYMNDQMNYPPYYSQYPKQGQSNYEYASPTFPQRNNDMGAKYNNGQNMTKTFDTLSRVSQVSAFSLNENPGYMVYNFQRNFVSTFKEMQQGFIDQTNQSLSYSQSNVIFFFPFNIT